MSGPDPAGSRPPARFLSLVARTTGVRPEEAGTVLLACAYFFSVLASYYVIRPIRDEAGVAGGMDNLAWLFTATLLGMLVAHPLFSAAVSRWPRRRFVAVCYRFFMANLAVFFLLMKTAPEGTLVWIGRVFFVWTSIFNLFVVSVFWSFMIDIFKEQQSKRLFGFIGVGGTLGGVLGSALTASLVQRVSAASLLWCSLALLECAVACVRALDRRTGAVGDAGAASARGAVEGQRSRDADRDPCGPLAAAGEADRQEDRLGAGAIIGGGAMDGIRRVVRSPYLRGISVFMLLFTGGSTFLYLFRSEFVSRMSSDSAEQTAVFAGLDLAINILTLVTQLFLTGRLIKRLGVGLTLALLPLLSLVGFAALGAFPAFAVLVVFQSLRRAGEFAVQRPVREVLYTVLPRQDRYKAKNFNDNVVYRAGDLVGVWSFSLLGALGLGVAAFALSMVPVSAVWLMVALWLGRRQDSERERTRRVRTPTAP